MSPMSVSVRPLLAAGFDLKGLKKWNTRDGGGYQFTLTRAGVPVAEVTNDGHGGQTRIQWIGEWGANPIKSGKDLVRVAEARAALDAIVAVTPEVESFGMMLKPDADWFMEELVNLADLRKVCKKKTAFREAGGAEDQYRVVNAPCDERVRAYIALKYPGATILNDEVGT